MAGDNVTVLSGAAPLLELEADYNKYRIKALKYPDNVDDLAHLMMFNINVNEFSKDPQANFNGDRARIDVNREIVGGIVSETRTIAKSIAGVAFEPVDTTNTTDNGFLSGVKQILTSQVSRKTKRIETSIALYVPDTVLFDDAQSYEDFHLTKHFGPFSTLAASYGYEKGFDGVKGLAGAALGITGAGISSAAFGGILGKLLKETSKLPGGTALGPLAAAAAGQIGKTVSALGKLSGFAVNPMIEIIYNNPNLRQFEFSFNFVPRTPAESQAVQDIIYTFRRFQAPEYNKSTGLNGAVFIPPAEFDISFHVNTGEGFTENRKIPKISTCVLKAVNTNYAPGTFATFEDGSSTNITLRLAFQELDIITRDAVDRGF